jgi:hypothetical protein
MRCLLPLLPIAGLLGLCACSGGAATGPGGSSSSSSASSSSSGGAGGSFPKGMPIDAPDSAWTWVPFDNAFCGNGAPTGIGVNLSKGSTRVLIYMEGGGACWEQVTCYIIGTAANFTTGYGEAQFTSESTDPGYLAEPGGFFDRTAAANPFKDYSYVYVPYCTGDVHGGNKVATLGSNTAHFVGFENMHNYLERIVPTFPTADRVVIAGSSAGGYGAAINWWQTQQAFGKVRVDLIDDSGTPLPPDALGSSASMVQTWATAWGLDATLPPGCKGCSSDLTQLIPFYAKAFPDNRGALLSYTMDSTLPSYYMISEQQFTMGLSELTMNDFDPSSNLRYFEVAASGHVLWFSPQLTTNGTTLQQWVTEMVTDAKDWNSVHP